MTATWEVPPTEDSPKWAYFKAAYEEYVRGNWVHMPNYRRKKIPYADPTKAEDIVQAEFGHRLEKKDQPDWVEGGKMYDYQLEGMKFFPPQCGVNGLVGCIFSGIGRRVRFWRMRWGWGRRFRLLG